MSESLSLRCDRGGVENPWPHRLAVITAGATFLLILAGGLVTNTGAGLAVPDWPTTFGYNMFLYPWSKMVGGIFYEHSHRLIGSVVGLLTLTLTLVLWAVETRRWLRWLGGAALLAVIIQGVLGGLRVILLQETLAIVHGALAQAGFSLDGQTIDRAGKGKRSRTRFRAREPVTCSGWPPSRRARSTCSLWSARS